MPNPRAKTKPVPQRRVTVRDDTPVERAMDELIRASRAVIENAGTLADDLEWLFEAVADLEYAITMEQIGPVVRRREAY